MVLLFAKVNIFSFWPKTMDYSQGFLIEIEVIFLAVLLLAGRCYEAEFRTILLLLSCPFR